MSSLSEHQRHRALSCGPQWWFSGLRMVTPNPPESPSKDPPQMTVMKIDSAEETLPTLFWVLLSKYEDEEERRTFCTGLTEPS